MAKKETICQETKDGELYNVLSTSDLNVPVQSGAKKPGKMETTHSHIEHGNCAVID